MGCCISKCRPKKSQNHPKEEDQDHQRFRHNVQDKLMVISQTPNTTTQKFPIVNPNKFVSPSKTPPSPCHSTSSSSVSSFVTCTTSKISISSSSSISSSASSALSTKDKSLFSNEFLRSCYKENPHIVRINSLKEALTNRPITCPQKRVRSNSPSNSGFTRQKSFRRDQNFSKDHYYNSSTPLRSPSPSRRFVSNGEKLESFNSKRVSLSSSNIASCYNSTSFSRREHVRPSSPNYLNSSRLTKPCLRTTNTSAREQRNVHRVGSKIDEIAVAEALARQEIDNLLLEDIDNPLISLDCFIFI